MTLRFSHKFHALFSLLVVLYLSVGTLVIHPHFHHQHDEHSHTIYGYSGLAESEYQQPDSAHGRHHSGKIEPVLASGIHLNSHVCPICEILAGCWISPSSSVPLSFDGIPGTCLVFAYQAILHPNQYLLFSIRGPPATSGVFINVSA